MTTRRTDSPRQQDGADAECPEVTRHDLEPAQTEQTRHAAVTVDPRVEAAEAERALIDAHTPPIARDAIEAQRAELVRAQQECRLAIAAAEDLKKQNAALEASLRERIVDIAVLTGDYEKRLAEQREAFITRRDRLRNALARVRAKLKAILRGPYRQSIRVLRKIKQVLRRGV